MLLTDKMVEQEGRLGRKNGRASTTIPPSRRRRPLAGPEGFSTRRRRPMRRQTGDQERLLITIALEASRCVEEEHRHRSARGGCRLHPRLRLRALYRRHAQLHRHDRHERLRNKLLREMASRGDTFYGMMAADKAAA
jgi:hypothetical protein